jgi:hypothetical protein|mmetsp:Transcript_82961/g.138471  ORF Transcript_82961/g.138471 Transcript_82961/m.138471 type:complete len:636 (-) Transcript_82961:1196-3103(-)|eukprot:CAMPEP_0174289408 /NCGR_PEP_ID=MMETSP0809-20121228/24933_1 /TAXON_ID=73025 ORGANISM="Eutreptiella gymnastica-like, Strain CCMP1594" /NCGR_SAMPLE_ID=MMETSP0809 /ASSEMBLY_ACC=CAM_ASM_000658 /LENGTH=635 /DNA_ID=CAMNT_0015387339 /DNA_START=77 /DNA_END=1984 /DNA_ORIENTATION=-
MGCGASQPGPEPQPTSTKPERPDKARPEPGKTGESKNPSQGEAPAAESDPKFVEAFNVFSNVFAAVNKEKPALGAVVGQPANRNLEIVVVCSTGDVYTQTYSETSLKEAKGEKTSWGSLFKQLKHQLKKSSIKGATGGPSIKLSIPADGKNSTTLELTLKSEGSNFTAAHRALLTPMAAAFHKFKAGDDSKFVKIETDGNAVKASKADSSQKIASLQTEIEPLSKSAKQAQDDARAAREQCDGIRKNMNKLRNSLEYKGRDFLYPDGPATYTLHLPQGKEHRPGRVPANEVVMASIREKYGGDPSVVMGEGAKTNAEEINSILEKIDEWDFDVFALQKATNNSPLFSVCYRLLYQYGLVQHFNIDHTVLVNFLQAVESGYHQNPYHNNTHAADVVQISHYIMHPDKGNMKNAIKMTENDMFACLLAACIHDFDHPGFNNNFHIRTHSYLATLYNDRSVLENHHCTCIFDLVKNPAYNIFASMSWEQYKDIRDTMLEMVLSTDMGLHAKIYQTFRRRLNEDKEWGKEETRLAMTIAIKMADISNCCRPRNIYQEWAKGIAAEFYNQGDAEARLGLPISPFMDRRQAKGDFPKGQISFMNYIVIPLFEAGATLLPNMAFAVDHAKKNKQDLLSGNIS